MEDYSRYFGQAIWARGADYYREGRVTTLNRQLRAKETWSATVRGSKLYFVQLIFEGERLAAAGCSCPWSMEGNLCKHEAAAVCAVQAQRMGIERPKPADTASSAPGKKKMVHPFPDPGERQAAADYRSLQPYFSVPRACRDLTVPEDTLREARELLSGDTVRLYGMDQTNRDGYLDIDGLVYNRTGYPRNVNVLLSRSALVRLYCSESAACINANRLSDRGAVCCPHVLALLMLTDRQLQAKPVGTATDNDGELVLSLFSGHGTAVREDRGRRIRLEPRINRRNDGYNALEFKVGEGRLYVVKSLKDLLNAERSGGRLTLGTKQTLDFGGSTFDRESAPLAELVRDVTEAAAAGGPMQTYAWLPPDRLRLSGSVLDSFFDLYEGKRVEAPREDGGSVLLCDGEPRLRMNIRPISEEGEFMGIRVTGSMPEMLLGARRLYVIEDGKLMRLSEEKTRQLMPLWQSTDEGRFGFSIGREKLRDFYRNVLPALGSAVEVNETGKREIARFLPPEAAFTFRLDAQDGDITCDTEVAYGEDKRRLTSSGGFAWADRQLEDKVLETVRSFFPVEEPGDPRLHLEKGEDAVFALLTEGVDALNRLGLVLASDSFAALRVRRRWTLRAGVSLDSDVMNLTLLSDELTPEELREVLAAYAAKKRYHRLPSGDIVDLTGQQAQDLDALFEAAHVPLKEFVSGKMNIPAYRALYLDRTLEDREELTASRDRNFRNLVRSFKTVSESEEELPESLRDVLRPYQEAGFRWMMTLKNHGFGGILADDMGLGKTLQLIAVVLRDRELGEEKPSLIVCPSSLMYNWQEECRRFAPQLKTCVVAGTQSQRRMMIAAAGQSDLLITSYDLLKRDVAEYEGHRFHIAAIDEAQYIKNHASAAAKTVKTLQADSRFALTGTPVENRLSELWSIFDFLMPGFLYGYDTFRREMETPIVKSADEAATRRLRAMVGPFILRRLKTDVLRELPEKTEESRPVVLEGEQRRLYDARVQRLRELLGKETEETFDKNRIAVLAELTRLRQVCCDPGLIAEGYKGPSAKREALRELLRSAVDGGHKVLVFSQFTSMLDLLEEDLKAEELTFMRLTGDTPAAERLAMTKRFNTDDTPVFLISLKAGGTGLNLTGADIVVHYDPWWNLAVQNQATDRAHRIGQDKPVSVYKLIAKDTIEDRIVRLQESKRDLADSILSGEHASLASLSKDELMALVSGEV